MFPTLSYFWFQINNGVSIGNESSYHMIFQKELQPHTKKKTPSGELTFCFLLLLMCQYIRIWLNKAVENECTKIIKPHAEDYYNQWLYGNGVKYFRF